MHRDTIRNMIKEKLKDADDTERDILDEMREQLDTQLFNIEDISWRKLTYDAMSACKESITKAADNLAAL